MNEIDDKYKQDFEDLDTEFLESHNVGITKDSTLNKYIFGIKKSRKKFIESYKRHLKKEKWKIMHPKKKREKKEVFKHLKIKHFNFNFNYFQKLSIKLDILFFNIGRFFSKTFAKIIPRIVIYIFYKSVKTIRAFFRDAQDFTSKSKTKMISNIKKFFKNFAGKIRAKYDEFKEFISLSVSKITGKKKEKKDGEGKEAKSKDSEGEDKEKVSGEEKKESS